MRLVIYDSGNICLDIEWDHYIKSLSVLKCVGVTFTDNMEHFKMFGM